MCFHITHPQPPSTLLPLRLQELQFLDRLHLGFQLAFAPLAAVSPFASSFGHRKISLKSWCPFRWLCFWSQL